MKKIALLTLVVFFLFTIVPAGTSAAQIAGVTLDDTLHAGEKALTLTGMGIRTKTFLKVKVYAAGLYMETPTTDPGQIISSDQAKAMVMSFLYKKVKPEKLQKSWQEGFEANTPSAPPDLRKRMDHFVSLFSEPALKGDHYEFVYQPGEGTTVVIKGKVRATIPGADFASALMSIWFGENLEDGGLKNLKKSILKGIK